MFLVGDAMHKIMCQLINRENDREALKTILKCIQLIKDDEVSIGVFPEGGIKGDGKLHHLKGGVFKIAQKADVPIVVCTLKNTDRVVPNLLKLRSTDVYMNLVEVIPAEALKGRTAVSVAEQVYDLMINDLGEEFRAED
jgi:1-acyl-sn-glycerol-3-phosphate acyltransferase